MDFTGDAVPEDQDGNGDIAASASSAAAPGVSADDSSGASSDSGPSLGIDAAGTASSSPAIASEDVTIPFGGPFDGERDDSPDDWGEEDVDPTDTPCLEADAEHARLCRELIMRQDAASLPLQAAPETFRLIVEITEAFAAAADAPPTMTKGICEVPEDSPSAALIDVAAIAVLRTVISALEDRVMLHAETLLIEEKKAFLLKALGHALPAAPAEDRSAANTDETAETAAPPTAAGSAESGSSAECDDSAESDASIGFSATAHPDVDETSASPGNAPATDAATEDAPMSGDAMEGAPALSETMLNRARCGARSQIAVARRASREKTSRDIAIARRVADHLPKLHAAKLSGRLTDATVSAIAGSVVDADPEFSAIVDDALAQDDYGQIDGCGTTRVRSITQGQIAANTDEKTARERAFLAARDRYVKIAPADDGMARLTAVLPAFMAAQINATLQAAAESARAAGSQIATGALRADALGEAVNFFHDAAAYLPEIDNENLASRAIMRGMIDHDGITNRPVTGVDATIAPPPAVIDISQLYAQYDPNYDPDLEFFDDDVVDYETGLPVSPPQAQAQAQAQARVQMQGTFDALRYVHLMDQAAGVIGAFGPLGASHGINPARAGQRVFTPGKRSHGPKVQVCVIIQDTALLGRPDGTEMAHLSGYGLLPARHIRAHFAGEDPRFTAPRLGIDPERLALDAAAVAELQRIYTYPGSGEIQAVESRSRAFRASARSIILARDAISSAPYSNAASNQVDRIQPYADGGPTAIHNAQGLDAGANYVKEDGDWTTKRVGDPKSAAGTRIEWTNPFGLTATVKTPRLHPPRPAYRDIDFDGPASDEGTGENPIG